MNWFKMNKNIPLKIKRTRRDKERDKEETKKEKERERDWEREREKKIERKTKNIQLKTVRNVYFFTTR